MASALIQMMAIVLFGTLWVWLKPGGIDVQLVRRSITSLVYYLFLPALVLAVMWKAPIGLDSLRIALASASGVLVALLVTWIFTKVVGMPPVSAGAAILAASFSNAVYLGLPVLEASFGAWSRSVAIQYDLLASTPILLSVGVMIARYYSKDDKPFSPFLSLLKVPPFWAMLCALLLNSLNIEPPEIIFSFIQKLGACVVPLMLLSIGMSLQWKNGMRGHRGWLVAIVAIKLIAFPVVVWMAAGYVGLTGPLLSAVIVEGAMPCMVLGIVICDRYRLDTAFFAAAVTLSTVLSVLTLPICLYLVTG